MIFSLFGWQNRIWKTVGDFHHSTVLLETLPVTEMGVSSLDGGSWKPFRDGIGNVHLLTPQNNWRNCIVFLSPYLLLNFHSIHLPSGIPSILQSHLCKTERQKCDREIGVWFKVLETKWMPKKKKRKNTGLRCSVFPFLPHSCTARRTSFPSGFPNACLVFQESSHL